MIKVLHIITSLSADGAQRMLLRVARSMDAEHFTNQIVSLEQGGALREEFEKSGLQVTDLGMRRGVPGVTSLYRLKKIMQEYKPDVIQGWMYHGNLAGTLLAKLTRSSTPVVWNIRRALYNLNDDKLLTRSVIKLGAFFSSSAAAIIHCAQVSVQQHEALGYNPLKSKLIFNGFDTATFCPQPNARESLRAELGLPQDAILIGTIGRFHPQKDYRNLLQAIALVRKQYSQAHFLLIGREIDSRNQQLQQWIAECGLVEGEGVHLLKERNQIQNLIAGLDIYCSSSCNEGFPNVVGEAMCCGLPCVVTDAGASKELVADCGLVVPRRDPDALAHGLCEIIAMGEEGRFALGVKGRRRMVANFSLSQAIEEYEKLYTMLASASNS